MSMKKSRSDAETVDAGLEREEEEVVVAGTFQDGMHNSVFFSTHLLSHYVREGDLPFRQHQSAVSMFPCAVVSMLVEHQSLD